MKLLDIVRDERDHLRENGRVSLRVLRRQFEREEGATGIAADASVAEAKVHRG